ncbi:MAG: hypothetical protein JXL97_02480 [Bacteroidales bacterium]|nr:hypothetical protein [Bacteroidales bacterium]
MNEKELNALFKLLADSDEYISQSARNKLFDEFENIEAKIVDAISDSDDIVFQFKAKELIQDYNFNRVKSSLYKWKSSDEVDLLKGIYYLTNFFYSDVDFQTIFNYFDKLKRGITVDVSNLTPIEQVRLLNFIFYKTNNFKVNFDESRIDTHMINRAFDDKKTSAFLMTVIYYILAKKLGIPLYMVKNKNILLLAYFKNESSSTKDFTNTPKLIFYEFFVNPSDRGFLLTHEDIKRSMSNQANKLNKTFTIVTATEIISILIDKLIFASKKQKEQKIENYLSNLKETMKIS